MKLSDMPCNTEVEDNVSVVDYPKCYLKAMLKYNSFVTTKDLLI